jgi:hypothetical protein
VNGKANPQAPQAAANAGPDYAARVPMIGAALAFACGAMAERFIFHPPWYWLGCAALLAACALAAIRREQRLAYAATLCAMACVGGFSAQARDAWNEDAQPGAKLLTYTTGDEYAITGTVLRDGVLKLGASPGQAPEQSIDLSVEQIVTDTGTVNVTGGLRLGIYAPSKKRAETDDSEESSDAAAPREIYTYGQRLELRAKLRLPRRTTRTPARSTTWATSANTASRRSVRRRRPTCACWPAWVAAAGCAAHGGAAQRTRAHPPRVARRQGRALRGHGDRRSRVPRARHAGGVPAQRDVSHPRSQRHERRDLRRVPLLGAAAHARGIGS